MASDSVYNDDDVIYGCRGVKIAYARECNHRYFDSWGIHGEEYCKLYED